MLLIEHYPTPDEQLSLWRALAWRWRCDLGYVHNDDPGLAERQLDALLAESWLIARPDAISGMAKLDSTGLHSSEWKADCSRWDRYLPAELPYTFEEILGRDPPAAGRTPRRTAGRPASSASCWRCSARSWTCPTCPSSGAPSTQSCCTDPR